MLKDEGRILSHGVSEGLQDFPKMECMRWDGMGCDVATATLFNGSAPSLLSPKASRSAGLFQRKISPTATQAAVARLTSPKQQLIRLKKQMKIFEPGQCNSLQAITYHSWCSYDIEIYMVQLWLIPARNFSSSHCVWEPRLVGSFCHGLWDCSITNRGGFFHV